MRAFLFFALVAACGGGTPAPPDGGPTEDAAPDVADAGPVDQNGARPTAKWAKAEAALVSPNGLGATPAGFVVGQSASVASTTVGFDGAGAQTWTLSALGGSFAANASGASATCVTNEGPSTNTQYEIDVAYADATGHEVWRRTVGANIDDRASAIALDDAGVTFFAGEQVAPDDFGCGAATKPSPFIAAIDASGTCVFTRAYGSEYSGNVSALATDGSGGLLVLASPGGNAADFDFGAGPLTAPSLMRLDSTGAVLWTTKFAGAVSGVWLSGDGAGGGVLLFSGKGLASFGNFSFDALADGDFEVVRIDASGAVAWGRHVVGQRGTGSFASGAVARTSDGRVAVAISAEGSMDFGTGALTHVDPLEKSCFVALLDASGAPKWAARYGEGDCTVAGAAVTTDGSLALVGTFTKTLDFGGGVTIDTTGGPSDGWDGYLAVLSP